MAGLGWDAMQEQRIADLAAYISKWDRHLDHHFGTMDVAGKRVLVIGSGWGSEVLWLLKRGAAEVVGLDPGREKRQPLERALDNLGLSDLAARATLIQGTTLDVGDIGSFHMVMSNNVLEHVQGLGANLAALAPRMADRGCRFHIFTDPLYFASHGHHLPVGAWDHLTLTQAELEARVEPYQWAEYRDGLNGMTITDFLGAVREAGMILLDLAIVPDHKIAEFPAIRPRLPVGLKPMDLCLEGISCTLAFPHNL